jgi:hypothetical protein
MVDHAAGTLHMGLCVRYLKCLSNLLTRRGVTHTLLEYNQAHTKETNREQTHKTDSRWGDVEYMHWSRNVLFCVILPSVML